MDKELEKAIELALSSFALEEELQYRGRGVFLSPTGPVRKYLEYYLLKGSRATLFWGACLDVLPLWNEKKGKFEWARTFKSAKPFTIGGIGHALPKYRSYWEPTQGKSSRDLIKPGGGTISAYYTDDIQRYLVPELGSTISEYFSKLSTLESLAEKVRQGQNEGRREYVLTFIMRELGRTEEAAKHLARYLDLETVDIDLKRSELRKICPEFRETLSLRA